MNVADTSISIKNAVRANDLTIRVKVKGAGIYRGRIRLASLFLRAAAWLVYGRLDLEVVTTPQEDS